ncbi:12506_t:CDS:2 [Rhizophagus irregularis]|nr:12506_t:CDS:2 [Rhizophagus irregularis]
MECKIRKKRTSMKSSGLRPAKGSPTDHHHMETVDYIEAFEKLPGPIEYLSSMSGHAEILIIRSFHWYRLEQPISRDSWKSRLVTRNDVRDCEEENKWFDNVSNGHMTLYSFVKSVT